MGKKLKIMSAQNISINAVEGERARINIVFDPTLDPAAFEIQAGNNTCPCKSVVFSAETEGQVVTLTSNPLPLLSVPLPIQVVVKRIADGAEWVPASGSIKTIQRLIK